MKIFQVTPYLSRLSGGPCVSVSSLSRELARSGVQVTVAGISDSFTPEDATVWQPASVQAFPAQFPRSFAFAPDFWKQFPACSPDIVHTHGIWQYPQLAAYRYCTRQGVPLVVSPRGMLEPWAFRHKAWKKRPVWWLYEKQYLQSARVLHATATQEAEALRGLGLTPPIAVIPNGVYIPGDCTQLPSSDGRRTALFLSRIHPKKGLLNLIQAWNIIRPARWKMVIAGPDEVGHEAELRKAVIQFGLENDFEFVGPVFDERKEHLIRQAELIILPSFSENFGNVIAEGLARGVPVITTQGTPWQELEEYGCGWWVVISVDSFADALKTVTGLSASELRLMGMRGRQLAIARYSWDDIAAKMIGVYEWVLGGGPPPSCIMLD